jgi:hypothetical protein
VFQGQKKTHQRTPLHYDGNRVTSHMLSEVAAAWLKRLGEKVRMNPQALCDAWSSVVGSPIADMTKAQRYDEGVLHVRVRNSTLLSLLCRPQDKKKLIDLLKAAVPGVRLVDLSFRLG